MPEKMTRAELQAMRCQLAARIAKGGEPLPQAWSPLTYVDAALEHMEGDVPDLQPETVPLRFAKIINDIRDQAEAKKGKEPRAKKRPKK